jgi:hypothetical protein
MACGFYRISCRRRIYPHTSGYRNYYDLIEGDTVVATDSKTKPPGKRFCFWCAIEKDWNFIS